MDEFFYIIGLGNMESSFVAETALAKVSCTMYITG